MKKKYLLGLLGVVGLGIFTSCGTNNDTKTTATSIATTTETLTTTANETTTEDLESYKVTDTLEIITAVKDGYTFDSASGLLTFTTAGEYTLKGVLNGYIECLSTLTEKVALVLDGITITSDKPAISWLSEKSKVEVKAKKDSSNYLITTASDTLTNSTIVSNNNIEFGGKGSLSIVNNQKHGVSASEVTVKNEIALSITANVKDGIHAKAVTIENGNISITALKDGIEAEVNSKGNKGTILITGGAITINNTESALKAKTSITFADPLDSLVIGILLKINKASDAPLDSESIIKNASVISYYLDGNLQTF